MRACAHLTVTCAADSNGQDRCRVSRLRSDGPLVLRPTNLTGPAPLPRWNLAGSHAAHVSRAAGAAGPLGGDDLRLRVDVGPGAALVLREVSTTIVLPGPHGQRSRTHTTVHVGADATLVWLPEPVIAARGCDHHTVTTIMLEPGARLLLREELLLGRHGENPGTIRQRLRICQGEHPLHDQELAVGPDIPGWQGSAVTGGRRAIGSLLLIDPHWDADQWRRPDPNAQTDVAVLQLAKTAVLFTVLAADGLGLRHRLDAALTELDHPIGGNDRI